MLADKLPLEGIRILDASHAWAGPHATELLADLGAEIIKIENPTGDLLRGRMRPPPGSGAYARGKPGAKPYNRAGVFNQVNRNKLGITLNLNLEEGKRLFKELTKISDVVFDNLKAGTLDKLGLGYESLRQVKPDIIMVSVTGYGQTGPHAGYRAYGVIMEHHWLSRRSPSYALGCRPHGPIGRCTCCRGGSSSSIIP